MRHIPSGTDPLTAGRVGWRHKACAGTHRFIAYPPQHKHIESYFCKAGSCLWWVGYFDVKTWRGTMTPIHPTKVHSDLCHRCECRSEPVKVSRKLTVTRRSHSDLHLSSRAKRGDLNCWNVMRVKQCISMSGRTPQKYTGQAAQPDLRQLNCQCEV